MVAMSFFDIGKRAGLRGAGGEMNHRRDACAAGVRQFLWRRSGQAMIAATEEERL